MKKKILLLSFAFSLFAIGCGSSNTSYYNSFDTTAESAAYATEELGYFADDMKTYEVNGANEVESSSYYDTSDRKLIKTVNMTVETENFDELTANVSSKINELGGYAQEYGQYGQKSYRSASITARIPKQKINEFLDTIEGKANVISKSESVEDVTLQYVDIKSHKTALEVEEERLLELLKKAETVSDIIAIEDKLSDTRYRLDSMESQLRSYDNKVDFVTVYLNIEEVVHYTPAEPLSVWGRIKTGFSENMYDLGQTIVDIFVWVVVYLPNIIITVVVVIVAIIVLKKIKKRKIDKKEKREK